MTDYEKRENDRIGDNQPSTTQDWNRRALAVLAVIAVVAVAVFVAVMTLG